MHYSFRRGALILIVLTLAAACAGEPVQPATAGWWKLNEGQGTTAADASGVGNDGQLQPGATWATGQTAAACLSLPGANDGFVDIPSSVVDTSASYTVMAWVKIDRLTGRYQTVVSLDGRRVSAFYLQLRADTGEFALTAEPADSTVPGVVASANSRAEVGRWYHLAGVFDADAKTITLYLDGVPQGTTAFETAWKAFGHTEIGRGKYGGHPVDFAAADISDVRIYASALTPDVIKSIAGDGGAKK